MRTTRESTYDLALPSADYPVWEGKPRRAILICSHPRSGSTLLGEALYSAGDLGCPLEYLHRGFRPKLAEAWGQDSLPGYVAQLHRRRTGPDGTLSIKLFWQDVEEIAHEVAPDRFPPPRTLAPEQVSARDYRELAKLLADILPAPEYVYLERGDRVRQAVSTIIAVQTGLWRSIPDVRSQIAAANASYDYDRILAAIAFADYSHGHWKRFFTVNGLSPAGISYEALVGDYSGTIGSLLKRLGSRMTGATAVRLHRQSNASSEGMVLRFLADHAARAAQIQAAITSP